MIIGLVKEVKTKRRTESPALTPAECLLRAYVKAGHTVLVEKENAGKTSGFLDSAYVKNPRGGNFS